jgi:uncharacterized protein Usg
MVQKIVAAYAILRHLWQCHETEMKHAILVGSGASTQRLRSHHRAYPISHSRLQSVLQTYVWQDYDLAPDFPEMRKFLDFWRDSLDGPLHSVRYTHQRLIGPNKWRRVEGEFKLQ